MRTSLSLLPDVPAHAAARPHARASRRVVGMNAYHYRRGGADTVFLESNALLAAAGWESIPFTMQHPDNLPTPWSEHFAEEVELGRDYSPLQKLQRAGRIVYSFEARAKLARLLDAVRPSIVHAHNVYHHLSPSVFGVVRSRGIPLALTLHDFKLLCPAYLMLGPDGPCERCKGGKIHNVLTNRCVKGSTALSSLVFLETAVHRMLGLYSRHVSRFIAPSRFLLEKCIEWGWPRERFTYLPNFVDLRQFQPHAQPGNVILFVGRLAREKGLEILVRAATLAHVPVWLVGSGPDEARLRALVAELRAPVRFLGRLAPAQIAEVAAQARAFILPSTWYENAPMTILEAYALGRPVIGSRVGGIPEHIREGETGYTSMPGEPHALAAILERVAGMPDARVREMGMAGRRWVEESFGADLHRERLVALYDELIRENR